MLGFSNIFGPNDITGTAPAGDSTNRVADTAFVQQAAASAVAAGTTGMVLQIQYAENTSLIVSSTTMAGGVDTIPIKTDGTTIVTTSITPRAISNQLLISSVVPMANGAGANLWMGLFQDTTTSALAALPCGNGTNEVAHGMLLFQMAANTIGPTTLKILVGNFTTNNFTFTINGAVQSRRLGGASRATLVVQEIHG